MKRILWLITWSDRGSALTPYVNGSCTDADKSILIISGRGGAVREAHGKNEGDPGAVGSSTLVPLNPVSAPTRAVCP